MVTSIWVFFKIQCQKADKETMKPLIYFFIFVSMVFAPAAHSEDPVLKALKKCDNLAAFDDIRAVDRLEQQLNKLTSLIEGQMDHGKALILANPQNKAMVCPSVKKNVEAHKQFSERVAAKLTAVASEVESFGNEQDCHSELVTDAKDFGEIQQKIQQDFAKICSGY